MQNAAKNKHSSIKAMNIQVDGTAALSALFSAAENFVSRELRFSSSASCSERRRSSSYQTSFNLNRSRNNHGKGRKTTVVLELRAYR
jgi:hypothetical protein